MLNGDAHYSLSWERELRIWPLLIFQRLERAKNISPMSNVQSPKSKRQKSEVRGQKSEDRDPVAGAPGSVFVDPLNGVRSNLFRSMLAATHISALCSPEAKSTHRILYVGCDVESSTMLRRALIESEFQIVTCADRGGAVLFLKSQIPYRLLLIDLEWKGREGLKLARLAQRLSHRKQMAIILVAPEFSQHTRASARKAGVVECVTKTQDMAEISETIKRLLGVENGVM